MFSACIMRMASVLEDCVEMVLDLNRVAERIQTAPEMDAVSSLAAYKSKINVANRDLLYIRV